MLVSLILRSCSNPVAQQFNDSAQLDEVARARGSAIDASQRVDEISRNLAQKLRDIALSLFPCDIIRRH